MTPKNGDGSINGLTEKEADELKAKGKVKMSKEEAEAYKANQAVNKPATVTSVSKDGKIETKPNPERDEKFVAGASDRSFKGATSDEDDSEDSESEASTTDSEPKKESLLDKAKHAFGGDEKKESEK